MAEELSQLPGVNVLVVSFDAFRYDRMGTYGSELGLTPNMDEFARQAVVFEHAYSVANATHPSFSAAFTGRYPFRVFRDWSLIDTQTIAEVFQSAGYTTGAFLANVQLTTERNFDQGFDIYEVYNTQSDIQPLNGIKEFLRDNSEDRFFAWVHFLNPHSPYDYRKISSEFYDASYEGKYEKSSGARVQTYDISKMSDADLDRIGALYNGEIYFADKRFGQVLAQVRKLGLMDKTVIVLTADHGEAYREHGILGHHQLYEEVIRIPLIVHHPGVDAFRRIEVPVMNIDFLPTLASIAGVEYEAGLLKGVNWLQPFNSNRIMLYTQMTNEAKLSMAMRNGDFKFLMWCTKQEDFGEELYNLNEDPNETKNLINDRAGSGKADYMFEAWKTVLGGLHPCAVIQRARAGAKMGENLDEKTIEALRSLGYIQ